MSLSKLIYNYASFNTWANKKIVTWLQTQNVTLLYQQIPSSFTSIDYTLQHILRTQKFWTAFISELDFSALNWNIRENEVDNIMSELMQQSIEMQHRILNFSESDLSKILQLNTTWAQGKLARYEYIQHVINHGSFHRGQIITIARNVGITENIPLTDYNFFNLEAQ